EALALERAYRNAAVDPATVGLIEAHGTGVPLGDQTEVRALETVFGEPLRGSMRCGIGSVKSMIGHLMPAAGIAGIIKTALALSEKVLPPSLNCEEPISALQAQGGRFYLLDEPRPWINGTTTSPRRAGVNSFGFGGINAHAVLEEAV
ncbi:MAG: polyketide synthase, partial [Acidobacteriota bacterium]|nr:polyketide synthase [Acidobacteriota bacterium]